MNQIHDVARTVILLIGVLSATAAVSAENQCIACHQDPDYFTEYPKLYEYYQQWLSSPHEQSAVTCDACHGGDPAADDLNTAHTGVLPMNNPDSVLHFRKQPETCGRCHTANRMQFEQSDHYAALMDQRAAPTCTTCHPAMSRRPELRAIVLNACRNCHGEGNSENLPLVADQAENVFQQLNIAGGLLGWTRIHYESHDWPGDSRERVRELEVIHGAVIDRVHRFDLDATEAATNELQGQLREIFDSVRRAYEDREDDL